MRNSRWMLILLTMAQAPAVASPVLEPCHLKGLAEEVRCGQLEVPEDRASAKRRILSLRFAILPALGGATAPDPLFLLAGGPGQAATEMATYAELAFKKVRQRRDIVLLDQRGTGGSHPLRCNEPLPSLKELFAASIPLKDPRACVASLDADPRFYTNFQAADDLEALRRALGYEQINLWGGSYGTRAALVYLRRSPRQVRTVVLDGVAPFAVRFPLFVARDGQRALDLLLSDCAADAACGGAFPNLREELYGLLKSFDRAPVQAAVRHPRTGERELVVIDRPGFTAGIRGALYTTEQSSLLPLALHRAAGGDWEPFASLMVALLGWSYETMSVGMTLSVLCSEDLPRIDAAEEERWTQGSFLGRAMLDPWKKVCADWPRGELPEGYDRPFRSSAAALILSGALDPVVPPEWGNRVAQELGHARAVVVPGTAHNTSHVGCVPALIADFIERGDAADLDTECVSSIRRPAFVVDDLGTLP